jgi:hypothetical protein
MLSELVCTQSIKLGKRLKYPVNFFLSAGREPMEKINNVPFFGLFKDIEELSITFA